MVYGALSFIPNGGSERKFHDGTRSTAIPRALPMCTHRR